MNTVILCCILVALVICVQVAFIIQLTHFEKSVKDDIFSVDQTVVGKTNTLKLDFAVAMKTVANDLSVDFVKHIHEINDDISNQYHMIRTLDDKFDKFVDNQNANVLEVEKFMNDTSNDVAGIIVTLKNMIAENSDRQKALDDKLHDIERCTEEIFKYEQDDILIMKKISEKIGACIESNNSIADSAIKIGESTQKILSDNDSLKRAILSSLLALISLLEKHNDEVEKILQKQKTAKKPKNKEDYNTQQK